MKLTKTIRPFLAAMLMLLFALSITPQRCLHDIFGCHKDATASSNTQDTQVNTHKVNCNCNQADLHVPFDGPGALFTALVVKPIEVPVVFDILAVYKQGMYHHALRGPPACFPC